MSWAPLLLADPSPALRRMVLVELLHRDEDDPEVTELQSLIDDDPRIARLRATQRSDGSWPPGALPGTDSAGPLFATAQALARLGYVGLSSTDPSVARGVEHLFGLQREDGSWPLPGAGGAVESDESDGSNEGYSMIPLQTARPLRALALCGMACDVRAERAYDWLLAQRLDDGAWPTGLAAGNLGRVAGYRRLAHSRWGCRSNTTGALSCLALHPRRRSGDAARRALDLLLGHETRERRSLGFDTARTLGFEAARGFLTYYARFDVVQILDLCRRVGADASDGRVADLVSFVRANRGPFGLWAYEPRPEATRWVTFDLLRSLRGIDEAVDWVSLEPRTPFQPYPERDDRS